MKNKPQGNQISLAGVAGEQGQRRRGGKKRRKLNAWGVLLLLAAVVLLIVAGKKLYDRITAGPSLTGREMVEYAYSADGDVSHTAYYLLGVTGEKATDRMELLSVLCLNRSGKTAEVLQIPVSTTLGKDSGHAAAVIGDIWGNPTPLTFCASCRKQVTAEEVKDEKHTCGTKVESRAGSSYTELAKVINTQYGLPVDNYLVIPRAGLAQLIDALGGVDVTLDKKTNLNGVELEKGAQTLSGEAAVYYAFQLDYNGSPESDIQRMGRQKQVLAGMLSRLERYKEDALFNTDPKRMDVLSNVMAGRNPIRMDTSSFGKARLMGHGSDGSADSVKYNKALAEWLVTLAKVGPDKVSCTVLPGESTKVGALTVYSPHREQTLTLLSERFNPRGSLTLNAETVAVPQLSNKQKTEPETVTLDKSLTEQTAATTTAATTTTTTAAEE